MDVDKILSFGNMGEGIFKKNSIRYPSIYHKINEGVHCYTLIELKKKQWLWGHFANSSSLLLSNVLGSAFRIVNFSVMQRSHFLDPLENECAFACIDHVILCLIFLLFKYWTCLARVVLLFVRFVSKVFICLLNLVLNSFFVDP